jgi:2-polyprenyl-3-methyl-5-hydroxy-6-metoxy-1,4-benzoquinol methylase
MPNHLSPRPTAAPPAFFDAKTYWETRLREHPGLCGVGNTCLGRSYIQWVYKVRRAVFLRLLSSLTTNLRTAQVFDVGSGTGFYLELWKQLGVSGVTGCDITEIAVARLRSALPWARILQLDIGDSLPASEQGGYDIVSAFDVLYHIVEEERYERALRNVCALLRPGGMLLFSDLLPRNVVRRDDHVAFRRQKDVMTLLAKTGFEVVCRVPMFVVMEEPLDSTNQSYCFLWKMMTFPVRYSEFAGFVIGGMLYPLELILTKVFTESPTTEIVVCRKQGQEAFAK